MECWSALRAVFPRTLLLFSLGTMTGEGQAQASPLPASAPSSDAAGAPALPLWAYPVLPPPPHRGLPARPVQMAQSNEDR
jgi:hypothetical protein